MHFDHLYGVAALAAETHATVYTPEKDKVIASTVLGQGGSSGFPAVPKFESVSIEPGNKTEFAGLECKVLVFPDTHRALWLITSRKKNASLSATRFS